MSFRRCSLTLLWMLLGAFSASAQVVRQSWYETSVDSTSVRLSFRTLTPTTSQLDYDTTELFKLGKLRRDGQSTEHDYVIEGLPVASAWNVRFIAGTDTIRFVTSTSSGNRSTGEIRAYFNRNIDSSSFPQLEKAQGNSDFVSILKKRIDSTRRTIDVAVYSFSGKTGAAVATALTAAKARGIRVRFIADSASAKTKAPFKQLLNAGIPAIVNTFGNNKDVGSNIHHNKFFIFDGRDDDGSDDWLLTGSWNLTDQQTTADYQNILYVQDMSLARAYEREFEEEWGTSSDVPDASASKFSTHKRDKTPRSFNINGREAHLFFSPKGGATDAIVAALGSAQHLICFAQYSFTRADIAQAMIDRQMAGVQVHGVIHSQTQFEQTPKLVQAGVDAIVFAMSDSLLLHHKYAVIDPGAPTAIVITGSQNWSTNGETSNNENVFMLRDKAISEQYFEEWLARYHESHGAAVVTPQFEMRSVDLPNEEAFVAPNPATSVIHISTHSRDSISSYTLIDRMGRVVMQQRASEGDTSTLSVRELPTGFYLLRLQRAHSSELHKISVVR